MVTFTSNPHPSDDNISGIVCNFLLSDGKSNIKLENLTEQVEVLLSLKLCCWNCYLLGDDSQIRTVVIS